MIIKVMETETYDIVKLKAILSLLESLQRETTPVIFYKVLT